MRITDRIRFGTTRNDMNRLQNRSNKLYKELSSGKRINLPSDDPFGALQATGLKTHQRLLEQYDRNISTARINLYAADNALSQAVNVLTEARTLAITGVSVVGDTDSHRVMADGISQLKEQLFNLANSRVGDTFIFGGFQHTRKPYTQDALTGEVAYRGDRGAMKVEIGEGSLLDTTLEGAAAFGGGSATVSVTSAGYTGIPTIFGAYNGTDNMRVNVTVVNGGSPDTATYALQLTGPGGVGILNDDNGGLGYTLAELNTTPGLLSDHGIQLNIPDNRQVFAPGDEINADLLAGASEDIFALFDELERTLREMDDINSVGSVDYDGNGVADAQDLDNLEASIRSADAAVVNPLSPAEVDRMVRDGRRDRFRELANVRVQNLIGRLDQAMAQFSDSQSLIGLGLNKVDSASDANAFLNEQVTTTLASVEDSDFVTAVNELTLVENSLQAAVSTTSRVIQGVSLLDYLR
ncbi:MAG: flagellar hook-associated protein FlgL [Myxococcota bacterium]|nr:flagellar hook-associated protein FlgL [Myxococcota bacterium]